MTAQRVSSVGLLAAVVFSGGWLFYAAGHLLPLPGGKFVALTPFLAFSMAIAIDRVRSPWAISMTAIAMGAIASLFTPVMSAAIVAAGLLADATGLVAAQVLPRATARTVQATAFSFWGFWTFLASVVYLTRNPLYAAVSALQLAVIALAVAIVSAVGARLGEHFSRRIRNGFRQSR